MAISLYVFITLTLVTCENRFVYHPYSFGQQVEHETLVHPCAEEVYFDAPVGVRLHGNLLLSGNYIDENTIPILFCHGNGGWIGVNTEWIFFEPQEIHAREGAQPAKYAMFLFDYRGYGRSDGTRADLSEENLYTDARSARAWLARRCACAEDEIVLMGHSLGGGVAVELAQDGAEKLVLYSTFDTVPRVARNFCPIYPFDFVMDNQFASIKKIPNVQCPLLQFHGTYDCTVPYRNGRRLFSVANEPKQWVELKRFGHQYGLGSVLLKELNDFLDRDFSESAR
ncbi:MAG: alpha/beta hydrolase [Planctomycetia bacterium]|nr:alpha/beta hydrolase [Planctomycetia bacterium]